MSITISKKYSFEISINSPTILVRNHSQLDQLDFESSGHTGFASSSEVDTLLDDKQDKLVAGDNITIDENTNVISASVGNSYEPDGVTIVLNEKDKLKVSEKIEIDGGFL